MSVCGRKIDAPRARRPLGQVHAPLLFPSHTTAAAAAATTITMHACGKGVSWTLRNTPAANNWYSVCWGNNVYVAVAWTGSGNRVMRSVDGVSWTSQNAATETQWFAVTYGTTPGLFVAVSQSGSNNRVMTSPDGKRSPMGRSGDQGGGSRGPGD